MTVESSCQKTYGIGTLDYHLCKLYQKNRYLDKYGGSLIITMLTCTIFFIIFGYFYIQTHLKQIRGNWPAERCRPIIMPFAGMINAPTGQSSSDYTQENFAACMSSIFESIAKVFMLPVNFTVGTANTSIGNVGTHLGVLRNIMTYIRNVLEKIVSDITGKIFNVTLALRRIMIKMKAALDKTGATLTTGIYTGVAGVYAVMAFFWILIAIGFEIVGINILGFGISLALWEFVPAVVFILLAITILVPLIMVVVNIDKISYYTQHNACFVGTTQVAMQNGKKQIKDIHIGETLCDGGKVTAVFKLSTYQQELYNLNDILVTGNHSVYHPNKGYIPVEQHPASFKIIDPRIPYVYCLNTTTKKLIINNHIFLDWDEMENTDISKLCLVAKKHLPILPLLKHIHIHMDGGFVGETMIELEDGRSVFIKDIVVNDQLRFGERVLGIVEIEGSNLATIKKYMIDERLFIGGPNLRINDRDLGIQSTLEMAGIPINKPEKLYHLLTDTKFLTINGIQFFDYNGAIEPLLWEDCYNNTQLATF